MNTPAKRKNHYIDAALQNRLLIAFILLEVLIIGGGMLVMYRELNDVVEENLFRIHFSALQPLSTLLFWKGMRILAALVILNVAALGLAEWWWERHLESILQPLSGLLTRTAQLDFTADEMNGELHAVLVNTMAWRECERQRCMAMRAALSVLDENADYSTKAELEKARSALETLKALQPQNRAIGGAIEAKS